MGLDVLHPGLENPFPWLAKTIDVKKEQNFFEGRVTEYQKSSSLSEVSDDELLNDNKIKIQGFKMGKYKITDGRGDRDFHIAEVADVIGEAVTDLMISLGNK